MHTISTITAKDWRGIINAIIVCLMFSGTSSWAGNLEALRASGAIGERTDGYVVAREPSVQAEADGINAQRRAIYQEKAAAQGIDVEQVGKVYAEEILRKVPPGTWIQVNGQWQKK